MLKHFSIWSIFPLMWKITSYVNWMDIRQWQTQSQNTLSKFLIKGSSSVPTIEHFDEDLYSILISFRRYMKIFNQIISKWYTIFFKSDILIIEFPFLFCFRQQNVNCSHFSKDLQQVIIPSTMIKTLFLSVSNKKNKLFSVWERNIMFKY